MEVETAVETHLVFAGDQIKFSVELLPPPVTLAGSVPPVLLSGYAVVQGSFKLGEMLLSEPFADTRKQGIVLTKRGIDYGQPHSSGSLFSGVLDGLKQLVVTNANADDNQSGSPGSGRKSTNSSGTDGIHAGHERGSPRSTLDYDDGEYPIFSTSQLLLFTDLHLKEPQKFYFVVDLPRELPPTYRSRSLHISYNLVVGFERIRLDANSKPIDSKPVDVRLFLPFRVLAKPPTPSEPHPPKFDLRRPINAPPPRLIGDNGISANEYRDETDTGESMASFIDSLLDDSALAARRKRSSSVANMPGAQYTKVNYDISKSKVSVAQLVLAKPMICVGDVLAAQIKLKRPCLHISVYLELEELIEEPYAALAHTPLSGNMGTGQVVNGQSGSNNDSDVSTAYIIYARHFQGVYGLKEVPLYLPTLTSITSRLDTEQVTAGWSLRIEFVGLTGSAFSVDEHDGLLAKGQVDHEVFTCRIPVTILPPTLGGHSVAKTWRL